jgi:hypothetical protein
MSTVTKDDLHRLIDTLPDEDLDRAGQLLAALVDDDPVGIALALAPLDDEPETDEERAAVAEAEAAIARGEVLTHEQLKRELGL